MSENKRRVKPLNNVKRLLLDAGIPNSAVATTLEAENRLDLRRIVEEGEYLAEDGTSKNILFTVSQTANLENTALLYHLMGKELMLSGRRFVRMPIPEILRFLDIGVDPVIERTTEKDVIGIPDFYRWHRNDAVGPFTSLQRLAFEEWFTQSHERFNAMFLLYSNKPAAEMEHWYTEDFVIYVTGSSLMLSATPNRR